ncbi:MAG: phosphonate ABC transporter substrate-binding protein, partial [Pseudomonadota bacterium]
PQSTDSVRGSRGSNLPQGLKDAVGDALMAVPEKDTNAFKMMTGFAPDDPNPQTGWIRVNHERYQWIVDMRAWLKKQRRS